jgi:nanoRNase/pAp phosphatase (c-di-AMP/oligoRNAs hydrolase)
VSSNIREDLYLFTDCDIDGAGCYYLLRKYIGLDFGHTRTSEKTIKDDFLNLKNKEQYKKIYICDIAITDAIRDIVDLPNVVYINHRNVTQTLFKNLRQESQEASSCTLLLYKKLKEKLKTPFTREEKILISLIDDYDSYQLKFPESLKLHYLFSSFNNDKLTTFFNTFKDGFTGFTEQQENLITNITDKIESTFKSLKIFKGNLKISSNNTVVCSTFNNIYPSEICDKIIKTYDCDIAISVNLASSSVSIRKKRECPVDLGALAKKVFDGGGDASVAGGKITKTFLELSKLLYPIT